MGVESRRRRRCGRAKQAATHSRTRAEVNKMAVSVCVWDERNEEREEGKV